MKKLLCLLVFVVLGFSSCSKNKMYTKEGIIEVQEVIKEKFDTKIEVYELTISAPIIKSNLSSIQRVYKEDGVFYHDSFCVSCTSYFKKYCESCYGSNFSQRRRFSDQSDYETRKAFRIDEVDMSMVPTRYQEALDLLKERGLFSENVEYFLKYWCFKSDEKGNMLSSFELEHSIGSFTGHNTHTTFIYTDYYQFKIDVNSKLILVKGSKF